MSLDGQYDDANIFAKIVRGEVPSVKVFETEDVLAFMDAFPQSPGHCLVISKVSRARNLLDVEPEVLTVMMAAVQRLARAVEAGLKPDGLVVNQYNGSPAGQTIFHLHFHVIPRWLDQPMGRHGTDMADPEVLKQQAAKIIAALD